VIPENDPDEQQKRLRYNDLVAACVIVQNTVAMTQTIRERERKGVRRSDLAFLTPRRGARLSVKNSVRMRSAMASGVETSIWKGMAISL